MGAHQQTFLFTDIVGSTRLWQHDAASMEAALEAHDQRLRAAVSSKGGTVFAGGGDGFAVVFANASGAISAAIAAQTAIEGLAVSGESLQVRMGVHTGPAQERGGDFFGLAVNRAARLASAAQGGQILLSAATASLLGDTFELTPLGEHRLADLLEPIAVSQVGSEPFPPIRSLDPRKHNLPVRFSSFVGRDSLQAEVIDALEGHRLVTLVGPGGIGKTSLALEAGGTLVPTIGKGVWVVELDRLSPGSDIEGAIASTLGMSPSEGWRRTAAGRAHLIILDNAEHIIEEVAEAVSSLLAAGSEIRFLVTSREALAVPGERAIVVPPLGLTDAGVELFLDRAQSGPALGDAVEQVVQFTDGIPLAIELVAAQARSVPLETVLQSLHAHGLGDLRVRGVTERHRSSRDALEWSYQLLTGAEQEAFAALALFPRDFSLESAAAVGSQPLLTVTGLVEKSLVHRTGDRFRLLEPIREFAGEMLQGPSRESAHSRLAHRVADLIDVIADEVGPRNGEIWQERLDVTPEDINLALEFATGTNDLPLVRRLMRGVPGNFGSRRDAVPRLLEILDPFIPDFEAELETFSWELFRFAWTELFVDRDELARVRVEALRDSASAVGDSELEAACDRVILTTSVWLGDRTTEEIEALVESLASRGASRWWEPSGLWFDLGRQYRRDDDLGRALEAFERAKRDGPVGSHNSDAVELGIADVLIQWGRHSDAFTHLNRVSVLTDDADVMRAHALIALGRPDDARGVIVDLVESDLADGQPTPFPLCPAADYFREIGDHRTAVIMLARMLDGRDPWDQVHHNVIESGREALGPEFDEEWRRGEGMDLISIYGLLHEL